MGVIRVLGTVGKAPADTIAPPFVIPDGPAVPIGHQIIAIVWTIQEEGGGYVNTITDTRGNVWYTDYKALDPQSIGVVRGRISTALQPGDTIQLFPWEGAIFVETDGVIDSTRILFPPPAIDGGPVLPDVVVDNWSRQSGADFGYTGRPDVAFPSPTIPGISAPTISCEGAFPAHVFAFDLAGSTYPALPGAGSAPGGAWIALPSIQVEFGVGGGYGLLTAYYQLVFDDAPISFSRVSASSFVAGILAYKAGSSATPVDLAEMTDGTVWRVSGQAGKIVAEFTTDGGSVWQKGDGADGIVSSDSAGAGSPTGGAPTLLIDRYDNLFAWYHTATNVAQCYRSGNNGSTWELFATKAGLQFPRGLLVGTQFFLCGYDGSQLHLYADYAGTFGQSLTSLGSFDADAGLAAFRVDRRREQHLVYLLGGELLHRYNDDETGTFSAWSAPDVFALAPVTFPGYCVGLQEGFSQWQFAGSPDFRLTDETYSHPGDFTAVPADSLAPTYWGTLIDRRQQWWVVAPAVSADVELITRWSRDRGATWKVPS